MTDQARPDRDPSEVTVVAQQERAEAFAELLDTLVKGVDVVDFLHLLSRRAAELTAADAVVLAVTDQRDRLRPVAASAERPELFEARIDEGPAFDCYATGRAVRAGRPAGAARDAGFTTVDAVPLRVRDRTIGVLSLYRRSGGGLAADAVGYVQAIADIATIGLLSEPAAAGWETLAERLQGTLNGRIVVEQAKGVLAERHGWPMEEAFARLRRAAHERDVPLRELASAVVEGEPITGDPRSSTA